MSNYLIVTVGGYGANCVLSWTVENAASIHNAVQRVCEAFDGDMEGPGVTNTYETDYDKMRDALKYAPDIFGRTQYIEYETLDSEDAYCTSADMFEQMLVQVQTMVAL